MSENARIAIPPGDEQDWVRFGKAHPELLAVGAQWHGALLRARVLDHVTHEMVRLRTAQHHHCER
jgi:hypothetical protein